MNKTILISNRCSGKTKMAVFEFLKEPENTVFIGINKQSIYYINNEFPEYTNRFIVQDFNTQQLRDLEFSKLIIDEYFYFKLKNKIELYNKLNHYNISELYIFSTPNKIYNEHIFNIIKSNKSSIYCDKYFYNFVISEFLKIITNNLKEITDNDIDIIKQYFSFNDFCELYYNFLTDEDSKIIDNKLFLNSTIAHDEYLTNESEKHGKYLNNEIDTLNNIYLKHLSNQKIKI
jgi:hypothetical protein